MSDFSEIVSNFGKTVTLMNTNTPSKNGQTRKPKSPAKKATAKRASGSRSKKGSSKAVESAAAISIEQRQEMVATAAYYIAEKRGTTPGSSSEDWALAELQISNVLDGKTNSAVG